MSNSSRVDIESLRLRGLRQLFDMLEAAFSALEMDFYLIGALARDSWFSQDDIIARGTKDVDFAVFVPSRSDYDLLKENLIKNHGFIQSSGNEFALISPEGLKIDLLPFGEIENEDREVLLEGKGLTSISLAGFEEVYKQGVRKIEYGTQFEFKVATLPSIVMLKLIAYEDRSDERGKDIVDIQSILRYYDRIEDTLIYDIHFDQLGEKGLSEELAARVIGREINQILSESDLDKRLLRFLSKEIALAENSSMVKLLIQGTEKPVSFAIMILEELKRGIEEGRPGLTA